jgi:predicted S18 family serine protease
MPRKRLMDRLSVHRPRLPRLRGLLAAAFLIGLCLGAALASGWYASRPPLKLTEGEVYARSIAVVGVLKDGREGRLATLTVELQPGRGRLLIAVPPYENEDTQRSAIAAKRAAERLVGLDLALVDVVFSLEADVEFIAGPSAGGAMAAALVAAMENRWVRGDAIVSATIDELGRLGAVGDIELKIRAAKDAGFKLFIVATNQPGVPKMAGIEIKRAGSLRELVRLILI